ncbi:MAG: hypothetical protein ACRBG0_19240 [Lewinella sp.]|uniref:hypothetical protein n=1 Tax=Lewinella sp. TaxID=2004506 RepID=UPI003D6A7A07
MNKQELKDRLTKAEELAAHYRREAHKRQTNINRLNKLVSSKDEKIDNILSRYNILNTKAAYYTSGQYEKDLKAQMKKTLIPSSAVSRFIPKASEVSSLIDSVQINEK